jgi:two-component system, NarL family, nitrate/nitrite response regulator NarL
MHNQQDIGESAIHVLVADNLRIYTRLLAEALNRDAALKVTTFESDASGLVGVIGEDIDVLIISASLDEQPSRGLEVLRELRLRRPNVRSVLLLDSSKDEAVLKAFQAGARGVFGKNEPIELLSKCIRCVYQGQIWANSHQLNLALEALVHAPTVRAVNAEGFSLLSGRELQVVQSLAEGLTNREIASRLQLSQHTIKNYLFRVFDKLGVSSRLELLYMTMGQAQASVGLNTKADPRGDGNSYSQNESDFLKKSAEAGLPAAQLALAQLYFTRRNDPRNLVEAYMWYLVATERALQAREFVTKMMTSEQIEEAQKKACTWLSKRNRLTSAGADPLFRPNPSTTSGLH